MISPAKISCSFDFTVQFAGTGRSCSRKYHVLYGTHRLWIFWFLSFTTRCVFDTYEGLLWTAAWCTLLEIESLSCRMRWICLWSLQFVVCTSVQNSAKMLNLLSFLVNLAILVPFTHTSSTSSNTWDPHKLYAKVRLHKHTNMFHESSMGKCTMPRLYDNPASNLFSNSKESRLPFCRNFDLRVLQWKILSTFLQ